MARYGKDGRMFRISELIRNSCNGMRLGDLARQLSCSPRTVRRYIEALQSEALQPIYSENTGRGVVWKMDPNARSTPMVPITPEEVTALVIVRKAVGENAESPVAQALDSIIGKLQSQRDQDFARFVDLLSGAVARGTDNFSPPARLLPHSEVLMDAIRRGTKIRFDYADTDGNRTKARLVAPLTYILSQGRVYLVGHCYLRDAIRQFVPDRMSNIEPTHLRVTEQIRFDAEEYARTSFGGHRAEPEEILLRLAPRIVDYFRRIASMPEQQVFERAGEHYARFRIGPNWALVWWISQYGPNVEVIEPVHLRELVAWFLREAADQYQETSLE